MCLKISVYPQSLSKAWSNAYLFSLVQFHPKAPLQFISSSGSIKMTSLKLNLTYLLSKILTISNSPLLISFLDYGRNQTATFGLIGLPWCCSISFLQASPMLGATFYQTVGYKCPWDEMTYSSNRSFKMIVWVVQVIKWTNIKTVVHRQDNNYSI